MDGMPTIIIIYLVFAFLPHYDSIKKKEQEVNPALFKTIHNILHMVVLP